MSDNVVHDHVCPWWIGWALASPLRKVFYNPLGILQPFVTEGMTVLEPGPGMGFFTMELARLVGSNGKVIAVDIQPKMVSTLRGRIGRKSLSDRVEFRLADAAGMHLDHLKNMADFVLVFAMAHEVPDQKAFFKELAESMKYSARMLVSEPAWHVRESDFLQTINYAKQAGLVIERKPTIKSNHSVLLIK